MSIFITILLTVLIFGLIIFIHEFGHFVMAKLSGVTVHEFALGMGPAIFKTVKGGTQYAIRAFPIGGYVSMEGEDAESSDEGAFCRKPVYKRIGIVVAGAVMNLILGFVLCVIIISMQPKIGSMEIAEFRDGAESIKYLQTGDVILRLDGLRIYDEIDLQYAFEKNADKVFDVTVKRNGEKISYSGVKIRDDVTIETEDGQKAVTVEFVRRQINKNPVNVVKKAWGKTISIARLVWISLADLVKGRVSVRDMSGPVGVATVVNQAKSQGAISLLMLSAFLTINVGIFNLLPFPALDGGRLIFLIIEGITRRPVPQKYESMIHAVGFALLMLLMVFVTVSDVFRLVK